MDINFDVIPGSALRRSSNENPRTWVDLIGIAQANPVLLQKLDWVRVFLSVARKMGEKNAYEFISKGGNIVPKVVSDEQAGNMAADGKLVAA